MKTPLLSICIATYNRADYIGETLESIIPQLEEGVELLVVDGASPDKTTEIVLGYRETCPSLRYVRLPIKGGVDQDYDRTVELAEGEYCWLFTDDDLLKPGAVKAVLDAIRQKYSLVVVNAEIRNADMSCQLADRIVKSKADHIYKDCADDKERFLVDAGSYLSFIGGVVIKRQLWLSRDRSKYYGSRFIHVGVIFQSSIPGRSLLMTTPWIAIRLGNAEWIGQKFAIWMFNWPDLIWSFAGYSDASKRAVCRFQPWQQMRALFFERALGAYSAKEYSQLLARHLTKFRQRVLARSIAMFPVSIARAIFQSYGWIRRDQLLLYALSGCCVTERKQRKEMKL